MRHVLTTLATVALLTSLSGQGRAQPARASPAAERQIEDRSPKAPTPIARAWGCRPLPGRAPSTASRAPM